MDDFGKGVSCGWCFKGNVSESKEHFANAEESILKGRRETASRTARSGSGQPRFRSRQISSTRSLNGDANFRSGSNSVTRRQNSGRRG
ncbi:hypothetical protein ACFPRL_32265 [Pseudoclavibacter helvolus]